MELGSQKGWRKSCLHLQERLSFQWPLSSLIWQEHPLYQAYSFSNKNINFFGGGVLFRAVPMHMEVPRLGIKLEL